MKRRNKLILSITILSLFSVGLSGCNRQILDTTYAYDRVVLSLPDGSVVTGNVDSWKDYSDGDQIQVNVEGVTYLVHSSQIALIND